MPRCGANALPDGAATGSGQSPRCGPGKRPSGVQTACRSSTLPAASCMAQKVRMTNAELVQLSDLNYAEALRDLSRRAGGAVLDEDGLLLFTGGHSLPVLANGAMRTE